MQMRLAVLIALGTVVPSVVVAQSKGACALLTTKEISDVVGLTVSDGVANEIVIPSGPAKGQTMHRCQWRAGDKGTVSVSNIQAPSAEQREAGLARIREAFASLKAQGWTENSETFGSAIRCSAMTSPKNDGTTPNLTCCMGETKGQGLGVGFTSPGASLPIAKIKTLFDKASSRIG